MSPDEDRARSVSRGSDEGSASAFDDVKVELGVVLIIAVGAFMVMAKVDAPAWAEILGLAAVGFGCGGWIAARTRGVVRRIERERGGGKD
ncbi:MAG TPA: hypothetical protein VKA32_10730 [Gammaproteobacteria bacterium]|nr:hypothetical protein [Gammaproteobacteria bacterium]